jgi:hypothetical protein
MKHYIFSTILFLFVVSAHAELQAPKESTCSFYLSLEKMIPCGPSGYAIDFGYPYCEKFLKSKFYRFSENGKKFLTRNAFCLQDVIYKDFSANEQLSCNEVSHMAFTGHADCFINSGFCELSFSDKVILTNIIKNQIPLKIVRDQMREVLKRCSN